MIHLASNKASEQHILWQVGPEPACNDCILPPKRMGARVVQVHRISMTGYSVSVCSLDIVLALYTCLLA